MIKKTIFSLSLMFLFNGLSAQKKAEVKIKTTAECNMCKKTIETSLGNMKGVKKATVDLSTKEATVEYNPKKTNPDAIRKTITDLGYDADNMKGKTKQKPHSTQ